MHQTIIAVIVFSATLSCSPAFSGPKFTVSQYENQDVTTQTTKALPYIVKACPGLEKYAEDFTSIIATKATLENPLYNKGSVIKFKVYDQPKTLPKPLNMYSQGNTCYIDISNPLGKIYIGKRACHSLCTGMWTENDSGIMGREFDLNL